MYFIGFIKLYTFSSFNIAFRNIDKNFKEFVKDYNIDSAKFMVNKPIEDIKNIEDKFNLSLEKDMKWIIT
ncbi:hypothetical protein JQ031_14055 [Clostridium botulinum]|nr:hypothetical protein [Clostridium botulinum]